MKKLTTTWKEKLAIYFENRAEKDKKEKYNLTKEGILHLLYTQSTTEQSLLLFQEISSEFISKIEDKLQNIKKEQKLLELFLGNCKNKL